jgi:hypothetical protein
MIGICRKNHSTPPGLRHIMLGNRGLTPTATNIEPLAGFCPKKNFGFFERTKCILCQTMSNNYIGFPPANLLTPRFVLRAKFLKNFSNFFVKDVETRNDNIVFYAAVVVAGGR